MGAPAKPTLVLDLEGVAGKEVKLHEWLDESNGSYYDCVVDWGDGTVEKLDANNFQTVSHTYSENAGVSSQPDGSIRARIVGKCKRVGNVYHSDDGTGLRKYLIDVSKENTSPLAEITQSFVSHTRLQSVGEVFENCIHAKTSRSVFNGCSNLHIVPSDLLDNCNSIEQCAAMYNNVKCAALPVNLWSVTTFYVSGFYKQGVLFQTNNLSVVYLKNVRDAEILTDFFANGDLINRTGKGPGKLYLMATPRYEDKALLTPTQAHINAAAAKNWVFADPAELSGE